MSIKIEKTKNNNELKLEFTIEAKKFDEAIMKVYAKSAKYFNVPGFRKGKAPFNIVERMYGDEIFYEDAFNELVPSIYEKEIEENKIEAVSKPDIHIVNMKKGEDLVFTATVQTKPEVTLGKYKGVEIKKVEYPVTDEDVEHELSHMQEHNARTITVEDRPVKEKDIAVIDFEGFVDGKPFEGGKAEKHELEIGSKTFIPGFEDQVIGMKVDEEKDIKVKFPEDYFSKDLAGKDATFKVKLHEIREKKLPELDDEFAKDVSEFDTLAELKASIKEKKQSENENRAKHETEDLAIEAVSKETKIDIPSGMIENEVDAMIRNMEQQLAYQGIKLEQYLQIMNKTRKDIEDNYKEQAEKNVKSRLILEEIIKAEKLEASKEEVDAKIKEMATSYGKKEEELSKNEALKEYIANNIKTEKAIELIVKNAKIKK
jgi:trigger factor